MDKINPVNRFKVEAETARINKVLHIANPVLEKVKENEKVVYLKATKPKFLRNCTRRFGLEIVHDWEMVSWEKVEAQSLLYTWMISALDEAEAPILAARARMGSKMDRPKS